MEPTPDTIVICSILALLFILLCAFLCRPSEAERKKEHAYREQVFEDQLNSLVLFLKKKCEDHNLNLKCSFFKRGEPNNFELDLYRDILPAYPLFGTSIKFREALWRRAGFSFKKRGISGIYFTKGPLPEKNTKYIDHYF